LLERVRACFAAEHGDPPLEITLEVNPSTLERDRLAGFRALGIDRISVGVQSFDDVTLRRLGRAHKAEEGVRTLEAARAAGFENLSLDLILGAPGQTRESFAVDLERALGFEPEHLSVYELTIESGTPFELAARRGQLRRADEDAVVDMLEHLTRRAAAAGLARYEISNFARSGFESAHNIRYWAREPVLGIGMGAWSNEPPDARAPFGRRRANPRDLAAYLASVDADPGGAEAAEIEILSAAQARGEAVFLALRHRAGLCAASFEAEFGLSPRHYFADGIEKLVASGLLAETGAGDLWLTERGQLLSDTVFAHFV
jgi:oxygen-independent coproporphyrinogen-3 oxidase